MANDRRSIEPIPEMLPPLTASDINNDSVEEIINMVHGNYFPGLTQAMTVPARQYNRYKLPDDEAIMTYAARAVIAGGLAALGVVSWAVGRIRGENE